MAKTVVMKVDREPAMVVLPASSKLAMALLATPALGLMISALTLGESVDAPLLLGSCWSPPASDSRPW